METKEEKIKRQRREYYLRHKEQIKKKSNEYYSLNTEKVKENSRNYQSTSQGKRTRQRFRANNLLTERARSRSYQINHPEEFRMYNKINYYKDMRRTLFNLAKQRAKRKGIEFTIQVEDVVLTTHCPVFGGEFIWGKGINDFSPSLDRIDSSKGYVPGNVAVISYLANKLKSSATNTQLKQIIEYVDQFITP